MTQSRAAQVTVADYSRPPLLRLPVELLHLVCTYLEPTEVANFRLLNKEIAEIGIQYIVSELILLLNGSSFRKLEDVSKHPVISQYAASILWEVHSLPTFDRDEWERNIRSPEKRAEWENLEARRPAPSDELAWQAYMKEAREFNKGPLHQYNNAQLDEAFIMYSGYYDMQERICTSQTYVERMTEAMKRFPRLSIVLNESENHYARERAAYGAGLYSLGDGGGSLDDPYGVWQALCLLMGTYRAGVQFERFECEWVDWTLLKQDEEIFADMKRTVSNLKELSLLLSIFHHEEECGEYLATTGRFQEFVSSAPYLVTLNVSFNPEAYCPITLEHIVGQFHWPHLEHIGCEAITATEDNLVDFLRRHAGTLKDLRLDNILLSKGEWSSTFQRMRSTLKLRRMELFGWFSSEADGNGPWRFDDGYEGNYTALKTCVEDFVLGKGECALIDAFLKQPPVTEWLS
ncbi:hypothetical protein OEA41_009442 [Lepraria neglecta]|uniref:F-box domain-containing protein n=1 Tax=Lepraria neglecta TaxID=209136 RepID=A0AAD9Z4A4_9LECA|nr:hypothetical protein OEA41_009442 [Lepraria neglecta]